MTNCGHHHIHRTIYGTYRVSFTLKGQTTTQSFADFEEAIVYRDSLVVPKIKKTRDRKAYMAIYNQTYKRKPKIRGTNYSTKGVYQAGPATVSLCDFSTEKPAGKWVAPEDNRRTKGGWSDKPISTSGPVIVSWT
jgi:hypothetical protein